MTKICSIQPILPEGIPEKEILSPDRSALSAMTALADSDEPISELSRKLFLYLRKQIGTKSLKESLLAIQYLAHGGSVSGARLLAAYLDVTTAGARLIPHLRHFSSTRRQMLNLVAHQGKIDSIGSQWLASARELSLQCMNNEPLEQCGYSFTAIQFVLENLLSEVVKGKGLPSDDRVLLVNLLRMETDAWQERISRLAGTVNPYRVSAVQRVLPILSRADSSISDIRQFIGWVEDGQDREAFIRQGLRALEVLESHELQGIFKVLDAEDSLKYLAEIHRGVVKNPLPLSQLGYSVGRLSALNIRLKEKSLARLPLDLISAVRLVQTHAEGPILCKAIDSSHVEVLKSILEQKRDYSQLISGRESWVTEGLTAVDGWLQMELKPLDEDPLTWPHGLPSSEDTDPYLPLVMTSGNSSEVDEDDPDTKEMGAAAVKNLVLSNITSISVLLGFLRNPKVIAVPGLVAAVAERTRNPQIIETIAQDRALHEGFANREVPLICLRSPCNVSVKTLRKFIHVKYVNKVDLRRMGQDRSGIRKEVAREIEKYLEFLG